MRWVSWFAWAALLLVLIAIPAIAVFNRVVHIHGRSRDSEVKANLPSALTAENAYVAETGRGSTDVFVIGFWPERGNRYTYFLDTHGLLEQRVGPVLPKPAPNTTGIAIDEFKYGTPPPPSYAATGCPLTRLTTTGPKLALGLVGTPPLQAFLFAAVGNIDSDPDLDCWSIASVERVTPAGLRIAPGEPFHEKADRDPPGLLERLVGMLRRI